MEQLVQRFQQDDIRGYIFQEEVGDGSEGDSQAGTPHLQGYFEFKDKGRWSQLRLDSNRCHFEKRKGTRAQNIKYCSKERTYVEGTKKQFSRNFKPRAVFKNVLVNNPGLLTEWQKGILAEIECEPDDRTLNWYWSRLGGVGKTTFCKFLSHCHGGIPINGKGADVRNGILTYMQANGGDWPELVLMNVPKCLESEGGGYISYEALENIKDMYFYSGKYEGGCVNGNSPHIYIFANFPPDESKMTRDQHGKHRFKIVDLDSIDRGLGSFTCSTKRLRIS